VVKKKKTYTRPLDIGYWILDIEHWILIIGYFERSEIPIISSIFNFKLEL